MGRAACLLRHTHLDPIASYNQTRTAQPIDWLSLFDFANSKKNRYDIKVLFEGTVLMAYQKIQKNLF